MNPAWHFQPEAIQSSSSARSRVSDTPVVSALPTLPTAPSPVAQGPVSTVVPLGWGVPYQVSPLEQNPQVLPGAPNARDAQATNLALLEGELAALEAPGSAVSSALGVQPEIVQVPPSVSVAPSGLPSDTLSFEPPTGGSGLGTASLGSPGGVLAVKAPSALEGITADLAPTLGGQIEVAVSGRLGSLSVTPGPGPGSCGPNPNGPGPNPVPCNSPYGNGPGDDPNDLECGCNFKPKNQKDPPPLLKNTVTAGSALLEVGTDAVDGVKDTALLIGGALHDINMNIGPGAVLRRILNPNDTELRLDGIQKAQELARTTSITQIKRNTERAIGFTWIDYCGNTFQGWKVVGEVASLVIPVTKVGLLGKMGKGLRPRVEPYRAPPAPRQPRPVPRKECIPAPGCTCKVNSFEKNTKVTVLERDKNGNPVEKQKPISSVKVGDLVYSYDEQTGEMGWYPVTDTISHTDEIVVYVALQVGLEHNEILTTTPEHPFYVTQRASLEVLEKRNLSKALENLSQKWIPASDLKIGDTVLTSSGQTGRVTLVRAFEKTQKMYNLEVARAESFTVGSSGWIAHNANDPKRINVGEAGHHVPAVRKSRGRPFEIERSNKARPTIHFEGPDPGHDHWRLHDAERGPIGKRQGAFPGTDDELFDAYREAYKNLDDIPVSVKAPDGSCDLGTNVTPKEGVDLIEDWLRRNGQR